MFDHVHFSTTNAAIQLNDKHVLATSAQPTVWPLVGCQGQPEICICLSTSTWVIKDKVERLGDVLNSETDTHSGRTSTWVMAALNLSPHADIPSVNCTSSGVDSISSMLKLTATGDGWISRVRTATPKSWCFVPRRTSLVWQIHYPAF